MDSKLFNHVWTLTRKRDAIGLAHVVEACTNAATDMARPSTSASRIVCRASGPLEQVKDHRARRGDEGPTSASQSARLQGAASRRNGCVSHQGNESACARLARP